MKFSVLSSGSKANSTYVEAEGVRILIDAGLTTKNIELRLGEIGISPESLDAILITHEHSDHILGVPVLSRKYKLPVFANIKTSRRIKKVHGFEHFETGVPFQFGGLRISPFRIEHDAADPVGYVIEGEGLKFAQATDLGKITSLVRDSLRGANALVLESNHDKQMLQECSYSWELKQRIASAHGHLSNDEAAEFVAEELHSELFHVVLAHLSENSNTPDLAMTTFRRSVSQEVLPSVLCGSRYAPSPLFEVDGDAPGVLRVSAA